MSELVIVSRSDWGATDWQTQMYTVPDDSRTEFMTHYHGGPPPTGKGVEVPREVEDIHLANGWSGTGYNFMVDQDGAIYEGRGWAYVGAHCSGHNRAGWGVYVAIGGNQTPSKKALASVRALYDEACRRAARTLAQLGHRDGKATECPGDKLYAWVQDGMPAAGYEPVDVASRLPNTGSSRPVLVKGTAGRHVEAVQERLIELGYDLSQYGADGDFGDETEAAVLALQGAAGIIEDGIVGPDTYGALDAGVSPSQAAPAPSQATPAPSAGNGRPVLREGDSGAAVTAVVGRLIELGFGAKLVASSDVFGPNTEAAVIALQAASGIAEDGIVGPDTYGALDAGMRPAADPSHGKLVVDGVLGPKTIARWQEVCGTPVTGEISDTGSSLIKAVQRKLNRYGNRLVTDGTLGPQTITGLQRYLGTVKDGVISEPSLVIEALQRRLNGGRF